MFSEQRRREEQALLAQDYALETARAEGIEQGLERGRFEGIEQGLERGKVEGREEGKLFAFLDMVRQGLLTPEVASQQLGMSVAEFNLSFNSRKFMKWQVLSKYLPFLLDIL